MNQAYSMQSGLPVSAIGVDERATFITRTYTHLFGAILGFAGIEVLLFKSGVAATLARSMLGVNWLFILGGFMIVNWFASRAALSSRSLPAQYAALAVFVFAEAIIFVPMLYIAQGYRDSFLYATPVSERAGETLVFWLITLGLLFLGMFVFKRLRPQFADLL